MITGRGTTKTDTVTLEVMSTVEELDLVGSATEVAEIVACEGVARITDGRSEERRVGKECRSRGSPYDLATDPHGVTSGQVTVQVTPLRPASFAAVGVSV